MGDKTGILEWLPFSGFGESMARKGSLPRGLRVLWSTTVNQPSLTAAAVTWHTCMSPFLRVPSKAWNGQVAFWEAQEVSGFAPAWRTWTCDAWIE